MRIHIRVPATSANIGSGFDAVGLALKRYNVFDVTFLEEEQFLFDGVEERFCNQNHLFIETVFKTLRDLGEPAPKGLKLHFEGHVPVANGLGSSSTCIVAGVAAALMYAYGHVNTQQLLDLSVAIEGHPDNVAPAILGGLVAGVMTNNKFLYARDEISDVYQFITITPDFEFPTAIARAALPKELTYQQAIYNLSRSALLLPAFNSENDTLIREATRDAIHQQYRIDMIEPYKGILAYFDTLPLVTSFLSGAGATLCLLVRRENAIAVIETLHKQENMKNWDIQLLEAENEKLEIIVF